MKPMRLALGAGTDPWTVQWPGECGDPEVFVRGPSICAGPRRLHAVSFTGEAVTADVTCPPPATPPPAPAAPPAVPAAAPGGGCAIAGHPGPAPLIVVLVLALRRRRR
jgi:hypothetical protein